MRTEFRLGYATFPNVDVYLNANLVELVLDPRSDKIEELTLACLSGARHSARAATYVLATGGIENARLLLASRSISTKGWPIGPAWSAGISPDMSAMGWRRRRNSRGPPSPSRVGKVVLQAGERKSLTTDRIILVPGPPEEVAVVRQIFDDYLRGKMTKCAIAESSMIRA